MLEDVALNTHTFIWSFFFLNILDKFIVTLWLE